MRLTPIKSTEGLDINFYKRTKWLRLIDEFVSSDMICAKVEGWQNKSASSAASALNVSIKRFKKNNIRAIERKGEVYLVKSE